MELKKNTKKMWFKEMNKNSSIVEKDQLANIMPLTRNMYSEHERINFDADLFKTIKNNKKNRIEKQGNSSIQNLEKTVSEKRGGQEKVTNFFLGKLEHKPVKLDIKKNKLQKKQNSKLNLYKSKHEI